MKTRYFKPLIKPLAIALSLVCAMPAQAGNEREELETLRATTLAILDALVEKGVLSADVAQGLVKQAEKKGQEQAEISAKTEAASGVVRVPYIPEAVKREIREQLRQEVVAQAKTERWGDVNAVPEWVERLKWEGDIRLRFQDDLFAEGNDSPANFAAVGINLNNTTEDRARFRVRARLGLLAKITDSVSAGFRITTGNTSDPVSTNQTLGTTSNKYSLVLDRAFAKVAPWDWLSVSGGRIPNPFFSTDLVWDEDVNFEGVAASFTPWVRESRDLKPFLTVGAFPLQDVGSSETSLAKNKWLFAAQLGLDWRASPDTRWRGGLAYYDYRNIKGIRNSVFQPNAYDATVPGYHQKGNALFDISVGGTGTWALASDFKLANITTMVDLAQFAPVHVILTGDMVKNLGYDNAEMQSRMGAGYQARTLGWNAKLTVGIPKVDKKGDWQAFMGYRNLQRDATLDAFTDSDFNLGGTNNKGFYLGGLYGVDRNAWLGMKWLSANSIDGPAFNVDVLQLDFNAKF